MGFPYTPLPLPASSSITTGRLSNEETWRWYPLFINKDSTVFIWSSVFTLRSFFPFQAPNPLIAPSPCLLWSVTVAQSFLVFHNRFLRSTGRGFCRISLELGLSGDFLMLARGLWVWGRMPQRWWPLSVLSHQGVHDSHMASLRC